MKLVEYRKAHRLTQADLAARAGVSVATISRLESGTDAITVSTLRRISEATGGAVTPAAMIAGPALPENSEDAA